jgi:hypothetical protein
MLERCECHECTQARWKTSFEYQINQIYPRDTSPISNPAPPILPPQPGQPPPTGPVPADEPEEAEA